MSNTATSTSTETNTMTTTEPDINNLGLVPEDDIDIGSANFDAPEQGTFPPDLKPGVHEFTFELQTGDAPENPPFEVKEFGQSKIKSLQVNYKGKYTIEINGQQVERTLGFQRANFYQSPAMKEKGVNSSGVELLRALGFNLNPFTTEAVKDALRSADGRTRFKAVVAWELYDKDAGGITVTTHARSKAVKEGKQIKWPRKADGTFEDFITPPSGGAKVTGRATVTGFKLPS
jgi:hypothetical protein